MTVSMEPGVGSKWQGLALQEQGVHPRVEPDPLLDLLAELAVRPLLVEPDPLLDLAELAVRLLVELDPPLDQPRFPSCRLIIKT